MDFLHHLLDALRANPLLGAVAAAAVIACAALLIRKPKIQREADERLAALRRDKTDQYGKLRPPH